MWSSCQCPWSGGCVDAISMWWTVNIGIEDGGDGMVVVWICMEERDFFKIIHSFFFYFFFSLFLPKTFPWQIFLSWFSLQKILDFFPFSFTPYWGSKQLTCQNLVLWLMGLLCFWKNQKVKITGTYILVDLIEIDR